jgi:hypothetical protein
MLSYAYIMSMRHCRPLVEFLPHVFNHVDVMGLLGAFFVNVRQQLALGLSLRGII